KNNNNYYGPFSESVIGMLSLLNTKESEKILNEFLLLSNIDVKQIAAIALLKNNNKVPALEINKISADKYSRVYFYNQLKKIDKPNTFPSKWFSQKSFAEGYLYNYIRDEDEMAEPLSIQYITEKIATQKGKQYRYLLFKAIFDFDGNKESHLAICGPFNIDKSKADINEDEKRIQIFYDEKFLSAGMDTSFKTYLKNSLQNE
ncbi:MAG: hypothetical protein ABIO81_03305, partial [Ginsengibacter sp.]